MKFLPLQPGEEPGAEKLTRPKMRNRCYPVKAMFMGVVACPRKDKNFDGKILMERVSKEKTIRTETTHTNFSSDVVTNHLINSGKWREIGNFNEDTNWTVSELLETVVSYYDLSEEVESRLELQYKTHSRGRNPPQ